jgi:hypothetical protein
MTKQQRLDDISQQAQVIATRIKKLSRPNPKRTRNRENQRIVMIFRFALTLAVLRAEWYMVASQPDPSFAKGGLSGMGIEKLNQNQTHAK